MTPDDAKWQACLPLFSATSGPEARDRAVRAVEDQFRRAFPNADVSVTLDEDTENEAMIREVLEEPKDSTVLVTVRVPVVLDRVSMIVNVSGDERHGDDGNDG